MEKDRSSKVVAVVALLVAVVSLSVGFATLTRNLNITIEDADVNPTGDSFKVEFSNAEGSLSAGAVAAVASGVAGASGEAATITNISETNNTPKLTGLEAHFTAPGQTVTYTVYAHNTGEFLAYLKSIAIGNAAGASVPVKCEEGEGTTASYVQQACAGIKLGVQVGDEAKTYQSSNTYSDHELAVGEAEPVVITLEYEAGADEADGDFTVKFGDVTLGYSSVDGQ